MEARLRRRPAQAARGAGGSAPGECRRCGRARGAAAGAGGGWRQRAQAHGAARAGRGARGRAACGPARRKGDGAGWPERRAQSGGGASGGRKRVAGPGVSRCGQLRAWAQCGAGVVRSGLRRAAPSGWWRRGRRRQANTEAGLSGVVVCGGPDP
jgi:hypothetical protein